MWPAPEKGCRGFGGGVSHMPDAARRALRQFPFFFLCALSDHRAVGNAGSMHLQSRRTLPSARSDVDRGRGSILTLLFRTVTAAAVSAGCVSGYGMRCPSGGRKMIPSATQLEPLSAGGLPQHGRSLSLAWWLMSVHSTGLFVSRCPAILRSVRSLRRGLEPAPHMAGLLPRALW